MDSGESGTREAQAVDERDTVLPLLLSSVSLMSQWSDKDELVDPLEHKWKLQHKRPK